MNIVSHDAETSQRRKKIQACYFIYFFASHIFAVTQYVKVVP